jgi:hypothetical protein
VLDLPRPLKIICLSLLLVLLACTAFLNASSRPAPRSVDQDYIAALIAANRFLQAWQTHDHETAILLLTDKVKRHTREDRLEAFFNPAAHAEQAYEINAGKKLGPGRYIFRVTLFSSGQKSSHPHASQLVIIRSGMNDWAVDKMP